MPGSNEPWNILTPYMNGQASNPSLLQGMWASPLGRMVQGGVVDPLMGAPQLMTHLLATADPGLSRYQTMMDNTVNAVGQNYNAARLASGQNINGPDWMRDAGGVAAAALFPWSDIVEGPEAVTAGGKLISKMVGAAANSTLTAPVDTSDGQSYVDEKGDDALHDAFIDPAVARAKKIWKPYLGS
jgi:hypothetical protein